MSVVDEINSSFASAGYSTNCISISKDVFHVLYPDLKDKKWDNEFDRINELMNRGNKARDEFNDNSILALGAIREIWKDRVDPDLESGPKPLPKTIHIIKSLKHPDEVERLREIYGEGFFLIGVHTEKDGRIRSLTDNDKMSTEDAEILLARDVRENEEYGQHTNATFHLADMFVCLDDREPRTRLKSSISRFVHMLLGDPNHTPDFDEYAMYMAFAASLRSADPSRQVGCVIGIENDIVATGANDCPAPLGGQYMTHHDKVKGKYYIDVPKGRDRELGHRDSKKYKGYDSNTRIKEAMLQELFDSIKPLCDGKQEELKRILRSSKIKHITEYGRSVHAEMSALMYCARIGVSCKGMILYTTLYPCHNCAKHVIAAGIKRVVYIEPYEKSMAQELHGDAIEASGNNEDTGKVAFDKFIGVGPRRFIDLFSMSHGIGRKLKRKDDNGNVPIWKLRGSSLRFGLTPASSLDRETAAVNIYIRLKGVDSSKGSGNGEQTQ